MRFLLKEIFYTTLLLLLSCTALPAQEGLFRMEQGSIAFESNAPLEVIKARSEELKGLIKPETRTFAFSIPMSSFQGFNSPLQREHFNENYLESSKYPNATFSGKIIEDLDFAQEGSYSIRAKGLLDIHGMKQERIIKSQLIIKGTTLEVQSDFTVLLEEHNISIPKIVYQKIAEEIQVHIKATFSKN
jgi:hypothetical protein